MNPQEFREQVPVLRNHNKIVYLDSATTTLIPDIVIHRIKEFYENIGVIPDRGAYDIVLEANKLLNQVRKTVSGFFNVDSNRIAFTTNTSHGSATAASLARLGKKDRVLFASNLHNSSFLNWFRAVRRNSIRSSFIDLTPDGQISLNDLEEKLNQNVNSKTVVVLDHAPMGFGSLLQIKKASTLIHETEDSFFFLDATRTAGIVDIDINRDEIDYLVCQGHTGLFGPHGTGILVFPENSPGEPQYIGSGSVISCSKEGYQLGATSSSIETDGTNIGGLIGLQTGIELINSIGRKKIRRHSSKLLKILINELITHENLILYGKEDTETRTGLVSFNVKRMNCHDVAFYLNDLGKIFVRAGEQCSHLLMKESSLSKNQGLVQISVHYYNTKDDIERAKNAIDELDSIF